MLFRSGHVSARSDKRPDRFIMTRAVAPALAKASDLIEWDADSEAVSDERKGFIERYIQARKSAAQTALTLRADHQGERVAAMMFLLHGTAATYQVGWSDETGRRLNAHNLLLWQAIEALQQRGVRLLDLGGVNTQRSAGIARFKMATGGTVKVLAGSYLL